MVELQHNMFVINAPAGSGKTTKIAQLANDKVRENKNKGILCITFTNRAMEELKSKVPSMVEVFTIHSFIHKFLKPYFSQKKVIDLFFEMYQDKMLEKLHANNEDSIERYKEKFNEEPSIDSFKKNIIEIIYNETQFNRFWYGELSHDDLLEFAYFVICKNEKLKTRLRAKYSHIFIDEYQDTHSSVLLTFYESLLGGSTELYLFGDKMQQIYTSYDGRFEQYLSSFDHTSKLNNNYRSSEKIVEVLNKIYNRTDYNQNFSSDINSAEKPQAYILENFEDYDASGKLKLMLSNKKRFKEWGCLNLFESFLKIYPHTHKKDATKLLTNSDSNAESDPLIHFFYYIDEVQSLLDSKNYGQIIQSLKRSKYIIDLSPMLKYKKDIYKLSEIISSIIDDYRSKATIGDFLSAESLLVILSDKWQERLNSDVYETVRTVQLEEVRNLIRTVKLPSASTQHGVKGEGHKEVAFYCEDGIQPNVKMYRFLEIFTKEDINFQDFQDFYYAFSNILQETLKKLDINTFRKLKSGDISEPVSFEINRMLSNLKTNLDKKYYEILLKGLVDDYESSKAIAKLHKISDSAVLGVLIAYKLFYVGCSRAIESLSVVVLNSKISSFKSDFVIKMESTGFDVIDRTDA